MAAYADYAYYLGKYQGQMAAEDFARLARRASAYLDSVTFRRIPTGWTEDERVKDACCALADAYLLEERRGGIASESNDGVSVAYVAFTSRSLEQKLWAITMSYLAPTGLLYQGVL